MGFKVFEYELFLLLRREDSFGVTYGLRNRYKFIFHGKDLNYLNFNNTWELSKWLGEDCIKLEVQFTDIQESSNLQYHETPIQRKVELKKLSSRHHYLQRYAVLEGKASIAWSFCC